MDIAIPLCGKGERFFKKGYTTIKPMIPVCGKPILYYLLDNLFYNHNSLTSNDRVYLIIGDSMREYKHVLLERYPHIHFLYIQTPTKGAAETLFLGLKQMSNTQDRPLLLLDGDTFYKNDIISIFRNSKNNSLITFPVNEFDPPHYSYSKILHDTNEITEITEKVPISTFANSGAYYFTSIKQFLSTCKYILDSRKTFKGEYYTSVVISEFLQNKEKFFANFIDKNEYVSLGTPNDVDEFIKSNYCFLFDLDGTLVTTDHLYLHVWQNILKPFKIDLTMEMFEMYIQGKNDSHALNSLNIDTDPKIISRQKDDGVYNCIDKIILHNGVNMYMKFLRSMGYCVGIVTNSNKQTAFKILENNNIFYDLLITANDVELHKPHPYPFLKALEYFGMEKKQTVIFEDSKSGVYSALAVSPACIVGIIGTQQEQELYHQQCNVVLHNSFSPSINNAIFQFMKCKENNDKLIKYIWNSLIDKYDNLKKVCILDDKLKGGYIADVIKVQLEFENYNNDNGNYDHNIIKKEFVLKLESKETNMLSTVANKLELYNREYYFYESMSNFLPISTPKFISLIKDDSSNTIGILLEYIDNTEYDINVDLNNNHLDMTMKIVDNCAKLHASTWNINIHNTFPLLKYHNDSIFSPTWCNFVYEKWELFSTKWKHVLTPDQISIGKKICHNFNYIQNKMSTDNLCICHGDVKSPNIFIHKINHNPIFIDWQYVIYGKGVADILFLMIESLNVSNRNKNQNVLLDHYYAKLLEYGVTNYTLEEFRNDVFFSICHFPFFVAIWFGTVDADDLIDKEFPFIFIQNYFNLLETYRSEIYKLL
jgi:beta-phosphoglucomutase-like phosphatase (HAD superfamily)/dTDP-glucose pyrophosphorylase